ncbi:hypothetical protein MD484_g8459, partial [Candolleomyces efflorescens]
MGKNQHKPNPPAEELEPWITRYYQQGKSDKEILAQLLKYHIDTEEYGLGIVNFRKMRTSLGLLGTKQQGHSVESIAEDMQSLRQLFPNAGIRDMKTLLQRRKQKKVPRSVIEEYFTTYEPELKQARLARKLKLDPFSGYLLWLRVWWNNSNPIVICNYYMETVESLGYVPLLTQSDPGTENTRVANAQSFIRQLLNPQLQGRIQHNWKRKKSNVKAEIEWSQLRRRWSPGFESVLEDGVLKGLYDHANPVHNLVFRFLVIPWIQAELDEYRDFMNGYLPQRNSHKLTPHGRPEDIHFHPQDYGETRDFKVLVPPDAIALARQTYVDKDHPVLQLVPPHFQEIADAVFMEMGRPAITADNVWDVYSEMLEQLEVGIELGAIPIELVQGWGGNLMQMSDEDDGRRVEAEELGGVNIFNDTDAPPVGFVVLNSTKEPALEVDLSDEEEEEGEITSNGRVGGALEVDLSSDEDEEGGGFNHAWLAE